jgi:riboflavin kinase
LINGKIYGAVVRPEKTDYQINIVEVIAPLNLRKEFNLEDGDEVEIKIWLN